MQSRRGLHRWRRLYAPRVTRRSRWQSWAGAVNGPGEAKEADFGVAGGDGKGLLFAHGEIVKTAVPEAALADELLALIQERIFSA